MGKIIVNDKPESIWHSRITKYFISDLSKNMKSISVQVNLCQKHLFLDQITHNMTKDCSLIYQFSTCKLQAQNMVCTQIVFCFVLTFRTIFAHYMFSPYSELVVFMYSTGKRMNNHLSYCGLVHPRISASDKDLPAT